MERRPDESLLLNKKDMKPSRVVLLFFAVSIAASAHAQESSRIGELSRKFSADYVRGDFKAMTDAYTTDAVLMAPGRDVLTGRKAIQEFWSASRIPVMHKTVPDTLIMHGQSEIHDIGYFFTQSDPQGPVFSAKYYIIWRKDAGGNWKMYMDMWNSRDRDSSQQEAK